jgi:hypothetical protein
MDTNQTPVIPSRFKATYLWWALGLGVVILSFFLIFKFLRRNRNSDKVAHAHYHGAGNTEILESVSEMSDEKEYYLLKTRLDNETYLRRYIPLNERPVFQRSLHYSVSYNEERAKWRITSNAPLVSAIYDADSQKMFFYGDAILIGSIFIDENFTKNSNRIILDYIKKSKPEDGGN